MTQMETVKSTSSSWTVNPSSSLYRSFHEKMNQQNSRSSVITGYPRCNKPFCAQQNVEDVDFPKSKRGSKEESLIGIEEILKTKDNTAL